MKTIEITDTNAELIDNFRHDKYLSKVIKDLDKKSDNDIIMMLHLGFNEKDFMESLGGKVTFGPILVEFDLNKIEGEK
ncbi:hypothetical protein JW930_00240 [Candidatus Woesearchaeota archaeon]|nr:hypothetical protein [Candidatus Woesearchaeota archaeon]